MAIYIFLLIGVILVGVPLCSPKCGRSGRIIYCCAAAAVFIFLSAMRFQVGYDYNSYGGIYFNMKYMYIEDISYLKFEKGFMMPLYVLDLAYESYTTVFIYTSIIIYSAVFYLIYKNSSCPWISVAAYLCFGLFFNSLCFLRQVIAALIVAYALKYTPQKFPLRLFVLVIAATTFHWSALVMLPLFFLLKIKPGYIYLGVVAAGTIIFCIFSKTFMMLAIDNLYMYKGYNPETSREAMYGLSPKYTVMFGILFIICFIFRKRLIEKNPINSIYINCLMYTVVFEAMGMRHAIISRVAIIVYMPILFIAPDLMYVIKEYIFEKFALHSGKRMQVINICAFSCMSLFFAGCYVMLMLGNYNGVVPYVSQIDKPYEIFVEQITTEEDDWFEEEEWLEEDEWFDDEEYDDEYDETWDDEPLDEDMLENEMLDQLMSLF